MATPPFFVEDQTDEDFFDKLEEDDFTVGTLSSGIQESLKSDEGGSQLHVVDSLSKLSLTESENGSEIPTDKGVIGKEEGSIEHCDSFEFQNEKEIQVAEESVSRVRHESLDSELVVESLDANCAGERPSELESPEFSFPKGSADAQTSIKEVQWSNFTAESDENDFGGFGSYPDFFSQLDSNPSQIGLDRGVVVFPASTDLVNEVREDYDEIAVDKSIPSSSTSYDQIHMPESQKEVVQEESSGWIQNHGAENQVSGAENVQSSSDGQMLYTTEYWESMYPGWKYDHSTRQWYQIDGYANTASDVQATNNEASQVDFVKDASGSDANIENKMEVSYLQQTSPSIVGVAQEPVTGKVSSWDQVSQSGVGVYPANMIFDPLYPGWYYDSNTQEWHQLDEYNREISQSQATTSGHMYSQQVQNHNYSSNYVFPQESGSQSEVGNAKSDVLQGQPSPSSDYMLSTGYNEVGMTERGLHQEQKSAVVENINGYGHSDQAMNGHQQKDLYSSWSYGTGASSNASSYNQPNGQVFFPSKPSEPVTDIKHYADQRNIYKIAEVSSSYGLTNHCFENNIGGYSQRSMTLPENLYPQHQLNGALNQQAHYQNAFYGNQPAAPMYPGLAFQPGNISSSLDSSGPIGGRTSAGRPLHALVTFGFGGKLVIMKLNDQFGKGSLDNQDPAGGVISVHNLMDVVTDKFEAGAGVSDADDYFHSLSRQSFPGPLVGANVAAKDVHKWIDDRVAKSETSYFDQRKADSMKLMLSLLKISCQHYGKIRSPFGVESTIPENDGPEQALTKLFASAKKNGYQIGEYGTCAQCLKMVPSEGQIRSTAAEVQKLLVAGRRLEALQCAQEGQLWGPALVLAGKLGEKYYVDTVKQMAHQQFVSGSPLRTLCLLIAGQLADVFSPDVTNYSGQAGAVNMTYPAQTSTNSMLDDWEENLAIIIANRTKDDELVIIHMGDCLWKETGEVTSAHVCYLVAEANFDMFSDSARLCLIGADHLKNHRTYASPDAIQRTELYEYAKVQGNSQFVLNSFQPYKLVYAHMLAEVGKVSDSLRYCQVVSKLLKNAGRTPEVESWKLLASSLEERLKTHQQGGYSSNLAPAKLVGKVLGSIDRSIKGIMGAPLPPLPPHNSGQAIEHDDHSSFQKVPENFSRPTVASLMPSASMESISEWSADNGKASRHVRSVSEPDLKENVKASDAKAKSANSGGSRFGLFGSALSKAVGLVSRNRQAKLGEKNKFYYDEKLKRWVEEGAAQAPEAAPLAPPPTVAAFQGAASSYNINNAIKSESPPVPNGMPEPVGLAPVEKNPGIPGIPTMSPNTNQFSARGRLGSVRSRYVDTFNAGAAAPTKSFQSLPPVAAKPMGSPNFFIPAPASAESLAGQNPEDSTSESFPASLDNGTSFSTMNSPPPPSSSPPSVSSSSPYMPRFSSMNDITPISSKVMNGDRASGVISSHSRASSWSGGSYGIFNDPTQFGERRQMPDGSPVQSFTPQPFIPASVPNVLGISGNGGSIGDELQEVEL